MKNKFVWVEDSVYPKKKQRGITLIALVITIIVLLILAVVSIRIVLDEGIITHAQKAVNDYEEAQELERVNLAVLVAKMANGGITKDNLNNALKNEFGEGNYTITGENAPFKVIITNGTGIEYTIDAYGNVKLHGEEVGVFEKYVLGETPGSKSLDSIFDAETMKFIGGEDSIIPDAPTSVTFLNFAANEDTTKIYLYAIYENITYRIICDFTTTNTESAEEIYVHKGNEGEDLGKLTGQSKYNGWTILYDYGNGTVEAVSPTAMGELTLGYGDEEAIGNDKTEKAIYSYNNAIKRINDYCKELIPNDMATKENVRSVGAAEDKITNMYTGIPTQWTDSKYNGKLKAGDNYFEQDFVRMSYYGKLGNESECCMASRYIEKNSDNMNFAMRCPIGQGPFAILLSVQSDEHAYELGNSKVFKVRPVIKVSGVPNAAE